MNSMMTTLGDPQQQRVQEKAYLPTQNRLVLVTGQKFNVDSVQDSGCLNFSPRTFLTVQSVSEIERLHCGLLFSF